MGWRQGQGCLEGHSIFFPLSLFGRPWRPPWVPSLQPNNHGHKPPPPPKSIPRCIDLGKTLSKARGGDTFWAGRCCIFFFACPSGFICVGCMGHSDVKSFRFYLCRLHGTFRC